MFTKENIIIILLILVLLSLHRPFLNQLILIGKRAFVITLHFCSKLVPKNKRLIVFGGEHGKGFRSNTKYLFIEMNKDPDLTCIWISKDYKVVSQVRSLGYAAHGHHSLKGIIAALRAKLIVHSHSTNDDFSKTLVGGAISFNTWHGVGLKKVWGANKSTYSYKAARKKNRFVSFFSMLVVRTNQAKTSYVVSTSPAVSSYYPETFFTPKENILELGQARNDVFFKKTEEDLEIPEWYRNEKVILYMPTHRKFGKLDTDISLVFDFEALNEYCRKRNYKFVIKRHMYSSGSVPTIYENIIDISDQTYDPQMLLKYADILMTDYSSCYTDYLFLDRPVIFYCYDLNVYLKNSNEMYFNYFDVTPGPKVMEFQEVLTTLDVAIDSPNTFAQDRKRVLDIFYSEENQGEVLEKQVNYLKNSILEQKQEDK